MTRRVPAWGPSEVELEVAVRFEARAQVDPDHSHRVDHPQARHRSHSRGCRPRDVEIVGVEPDQQATGLLRHVMGGARGDVEGHARFAADRVDSPDDVGNAQLADDDEPRVPAHIDREVHQRPETAADELNRYQPAFSVARDRRRQRDEPTADRRQRLAWRQHRQPAPAGHREPACGGVFAHGELEQRRQLVERDHLPIVDQRAAQRTAAVGRHDGVGRRRGSGAEDRWRGCEQRGDREGGARPDETSVVHGVIIIAQHAAGLAPSAQETVDSGQNTRSQGGRRSGCRPRPSPSVPSWARARREPCTPWPCAFCPEP